MLVQKKDRDNVLKVAASLFLKRTLLMEVGSDL